MESDEIDEKELYRDQYYNNNKYKRHTGPGLEVIQRWTTRERHWRKMGEIEKKKNNIQRRKRVQQEINDKINISKPYIHRHFITAPYLKVNPIKSMPKLFEKIKRGELSKEYVSPVVAQDIYKQKYINVDYRNEKLRKSYNFISTISNIDYCNKEQKTKAKIILDDNLNIIGVTTTESYPECFLSSIGYKDMYVSIGDKLLEIDDLDITDFNKDELIYYLKKKITFGYIKVKFQRSGKEFVISSIRKDVFYK